MTITTLPEFSAAGQYCGRCPKISDFLLCRRYQVQLRAIKRGASWDYFRCQPCKDAEAEALAELEEVR